jgi:hypothetical protein
MIDFLLLLLLAAAAAAAAAAAVAICLCYSGFAIEAASNSILADFRLVSIKCIGGERFRTSKSHGHHFWQLYTNIAPRRPIYLLLNSSQFQIAS